MLSLARKAGYLIIGGDNIKNKNQKMYVILVENDCGRSLQREVNMSASLRGIPVLTVQGLGNMIGIKNCKVVALKNKVFSEKIINMIKGE